MTKSILDKFQSKIIFFIVKWNIERELRFFQILQQLLNSNVISKRENNSNS